MTRQPVLAWAAVHVTVRKRAHVGRGEDENIQGVVVMQMPEQYNARPVGPGTADYYYKSAYILCPRNMLGWHGTE